MDSGLTCYLNFKISFAKDLFSGNTNCSPKKTLLWEFARRGWLVALWDKDSTHIMRKETTKQARVQTI